MSSTPVSVHFDPWQDHDWRDILTAPPQPNLYVVDGIVMKDSGTLISGLPHSMKSLGTLAGCLEVLVKQTFWGQTVNVPISSLAYVETEDPECLVHQRIREISKGFKISVDNVPQGLHVFCPGRFSLIDEQGQTELLTALESCEPRPQLIVLSTLQGMLTGDSSWNKQEDMVPIMAFVGRLCRMLCPVILLTHSPQDSKKQRAIGSVAQAANFAVLGHLVKRVSGEDDETTTIAHVKFDTKIGGELKLTLKLITEGIEIRGFDYGTLSSQKRQDILDLHQEEPDLPPQGIAERLACSVQYVRKVLKPPKQSKK